MAADNKILGQFNLEDIPPAPRGATDRVTFDMTQTALCLFLRKIKEQAKSKTSRIQASGGLSDDDIDRMVREAEENADADKARRELIEAKNHGKLDPQLKNQSKSMVIRLIHPPSKRSNWRLPL